MRITQYLLLVLVLLFVWQRTADSQVQDQPADCPEGSYAIAKYHPQDYDGQDFETGFEYGAEFIDIGGMNWDDDGEVWMLTWFIQFDNLNMPVSAVYMKAGNDDSQLFIYDPPKVKEMPPEPITIQSEGQGISHVTWCSPLKPTAITLTSFQADESGTYTGLFLLLVGIVVTLLILLSMIVVRTWRKK